MSRSPTFSAFFSDELYDPSEVSQPDSRNDFDFDFGFSNSDNENAGKDTLSVVGTSEQIYSAQTGSVSSTGGGNTKASLPVIQDLQFRHAHSASVSDVGFRLWPGESAEILQATDFPSSSSDDTVGQTDTRADMPVPSSAGGEDSSAVPTFASNQTVQVSEPEIDSSLPMSATVDFSQGWHQNYLGHDGDGDDSEDGTSIEMPSKDTQSTHADIPPPESAAPTGLGVTLTDGSSFDGSGDRRQYPFIISSATSALTDAIDKRLLARGGLGDDTDRSDANSLQYSFDNQEESISVTVNSPTQPPGSSPYDFRYAPTSQWVNSNALSTFDTSQSAPTPEARGLEHILSDMTRERERVSESRQDENEGGSVTSKTSKFSVSRTKRRLDRVTTSMSASQVLSRASGVFSSAKSGVSSFLRRDKGKKPAKSKSHSWSAFGRRRRNPDDTASRSGDGIDSEEEYNYGPGDQYSHVSDMTPGGDSDTAFDKETAPHIYYK